MIICSGESFPAMYLPTGVLELYDAWQLIRRWSRHPLRLVGVVFISPRFYLIPGAEWL